MTPIIGGLIEAGLKLIDKVIPDPQAKQQAQLELLRLQQAGELKQLEADLQLSLAQTAINVEEAKSPDNFRGGWRPFVGWVCGFGLAVQFLVGPLATWGSALAGHPTQFPDLDLSTLLTLLFGMLGLGALRSYDKTKGTA